MPEWFWFTLMGVAIVVSIVVFIHDRWEQRKIPRSKRRKGGGGGLAGSDHSDIFN